MTQQSKEIVLLCDIGGTNVRFATYIDGQTTPVEFDGKYKCAEFTSFETAVQHYLETKQDRPTLCVIGAAGNIDEYNGEVVSTNTPWKASVPKLKAKCPFFKHVRLVNDFALQGWALHELNPTQYRSVFQNKKDVDLTQGQVVIIGPGTGLGTCLILQDGKHPQTIYTSEAGHSTIPHIDFHDKERNAENAYLLQVLKEHYAQKNQTPVTEHLVSGTGITNIYHALRDGSIPAEKSQRISSEKIENFAKAGDPIALKTFKYFNAYLGAHAGTMAATTKTQQIFFCGGLMASDWVIEQLEQTPEFKNQFVPRAGMTDAMKTVHFTASLYRDMATLGAVARAKHLIETTKNEQEKTKANRDVLFTLSVLQAYIDENCPQAQKYFDRLDRAIHKYKKVQTSEIHVKRPQIQQMKKYRKNNRQR